MWLWWASGPALEVTQCPFMPQPRWPQNFQQEMSSGSHYRSAEPESGWAGSAFPCVLSPWLWMQQGV